MPIAYALIVLHEDKIEFKPPCPQLEAGLQPFKVGVDWSDNKGTWAKLTVTQFVKADEGAVPVTPTSHSWLTDDSAYKDFDFLPTTEDFYCKYSVILEYASGKSFTVDPVVLIKKPGVLETPTRLTS